jgi:outer membrane protein assembly factor BamE
MRRRRAQSALSFSAKSISCIAFAAPLAFAACGWTPRVPGLTPYKVDIQQGNYVTQDMVDKLKPGMTKSQVRFALGTPLIADPFHNDRWDYIYVMQKGGRLAEQRRMVVVFSDDKLQRVEGDVKPAATSAQTPVAPTGAPAPAATSPATKPVAAQ